MRSYVSEIAMDSGFSSSLAYNRGSIQRSGTKLTLC